MFGDVFMADRAGRIHWLDCSAADFREIAPDRARFDLACQRNGDEVDLWFGPRLVAQLHEAGKRPQPGEAFIFLTLPIFAECRYEPQNFRVLPANDIFIQLADLHQLYRDIPDGAKITHRIDD